MTNWIRDAFKGKTSKRVSKRAGHRGYTDAPLVRVNRQYTNSTGNVCTQPNRTMRVYQESNYVLDSGRRAVYEVLPLPNPYSVIARIDSDKNYCRVQHYTVTERKVLVKPSIPGKVGISAVTGQDANKQRADLKSSVVEREVQQRIDKRMEGLIEAPFVSVQDALAQQKQERQQEMYRRMMARRERKRLIAERDAALARIAERG